MSANSFSPRELPEYGVTLSVKNQPRKAKRKNTSKASKTSVLRLWGIPDTVPASSMRYKNPLEKGIYWYHFSLAVRKRDVAMYGTCISCDRPITVEGSNAGHFIPAGSCGPLLNFHPRNVNAECPHCNAWDEMHLLGYARNLDKRYGEGTAKVLEDIYRARKGKPAEKDFTRKEYEDMITKLRKNGL